MEVKEVLEKLKDFVLNLSKEPTEEPKEVIEVKAEEIPTPEVKEEVVKEVVEVQPTYVTVEDFNQAMEDVKSLFSKQYQTFSKEKEVLESKNVELSTKLDEKPDAEKIVHAPNEKEVDLSVGRNSILNAIQKNK